MKTLLKRVALGLGALLILAGLALGVLVWRVRAPEPTQVSPGPEADSLARNVQRAMAFDRWQQLEAVAWTFRDRHTHLWDKRRNLARVRWGDHEVLVDLGNRRGVAFRHGQRVEGPAGQGLVDEAYSKWTNDSFWLYPFRTFFHQGVTRATAVDHTGRPGLQIQYGSGGVTPGDKYLWTVDADGRPQAWRMWVSIIPVGGLQTTWAGWETHGGVPFSTLHEGVFDLKVTVQGAGSLAEVAPGPDPFAQIASGPPAAAPAPTSQPTP
ncbi:MAG: hypothetical protein KC613_25415 [Myxococcales bacterium]|nr:hypothetical protein [Myxococcales bacterium]MCB9524575.1 hypothetical protein [Myxococcales bacterium]